MTSFRFLVLTVLALGLIAGCSQLEQPFARHEHTQALAAEMEERVGVRPSVSAVWENGVFETLSFEFEPAPVAFTSDQVTEKVRNLVAAHFDDGPVHLSITFSDSLN